MPRKFSSLTESERVHVAVEAKVRWSLKELMNLPGVQRRLADKKAMLVGGLYDIATGKVRFL
jgi:carbonic anhydrase